MKLLPHTAIYIIAKVRQRKGINPTANNYLIIIVVIMIVIIIIPALSSSITALRAEMEFFFQLSTAHSKRFSTKKTLTSTGFFSFVIDPQESDYKLTSFKTTTSIISSSS